MNQRLSIILGLLLASCSRDDAGSGPAEGDDDDGEEVVDAHVAEPKKDATAPKRDASALDASKPRPTPRECTPGFYDGDFNCVISMFLPWAGKLHFELVAESAGKGEFSVLTVVPGTKISGNDDSFQGMFSAELQGDFDCSTGKFTGQIANGIYMFGPMPYHMEGPLEGTYRADGGVGLDGTMGPLTSPDFDVFGPFAPSATCTWQASYTGEDDTRDD